MGWFAANCSLPGMLGKQGDALTSNFSFSKVFQSGVTNFESFGLQMTPCYMLTKVYLTSKLSSCSPNFFLLEAFMKANISRSDA